MHNNRSNVTDWRLLGISAVALIGIACSSTDAGTDGGAPVGGTGPSTAGGAAMANGGATTGSSGSTAMGGSNSVGGAANGSGGAITGSGGSVTTGGSAATAGSGGTTTAGAGGAATFAGGSGPVQTCADPAPNGTLDVANVGTAPSGITEADLKDGSTTVVHYAMSVPGGLAAAGTTDPAKQVGLFIAFHEHGSSPNVEMPSVTKSLANLKRSGDFIVLGMPIETDSHGYSSADHDRAKKLLDYALKTWPINPRRVYLWGRGEGATMAHQFGTENKGAIAAMVTYSWGSERWPSNAANDQPDLYLVIGLADYPDSHVPLVRRVYQAAKKAQFNVIYREVPGLKGPTAGAITNDDAVSWAISSRHKTQPLSTAEDALLAPYKDAGAAAGICPDAALFAGFELVGGTQAGHLVPGLLSAGVEASRVLAAQITGRGDLGTEADTALATKLTDASASVRKEAMLSLGRAANWRNQAAQKALIDFSTSAAGDVTERGLAVDAIGVAVKYQIGGAVDTGGYQDPALFQALVTLLSDSDLNLRTKAFNILKPSLSSNYNPATSPASQQAAITAWQDWVKTLKG